MPPPKPKSRLRSSLGYAKWYLMEEALPALPAHFRRKRAQKLRARQRQAILGLPPVRWSGRADLDVAMICGKPQLDMGIAASWSLLRFTPDWRLVVYSDGSMDGEAEAAWRRVIPSLTVVHPGQAAAEVDRRLADLPTVREYRHQIFFSAQVIDAHLFGDSAAVISLDSDVLFLKRPDELLRIAQSGRRTMVWNLDPWSAYCAPTWQLNDLLGGEVPERLNAGMLLSPRFNRADFEGMEQILRKFKALLNRPDWPKVTWVCQTIYAAMAMRFPESGPLPPDYAVRWFNARPTIGVHYSSAPAIRPRFFTEGIPQLLRQV